MDVVVVGGGLAGLCTAALCHELGATVAVLEAGVVAGRTTGHSTAKLTALHGLAYSRLTRTRGAEAAGQYAAANVDALQRLRQLVDRLDIRCDLVVADAYTCAATAAGVADVEAEAAAARAAGLGVEFVSGPGLAVPVHAAVKLDDQAHFDPLAFCRGLADHLAASGVQILEGTRVTSVDEGRAGCSVVAGAVRIDAGHVAITTHLPVVDPAFLAGRVSPQRSYVVSGPVSGDVPTGMYLAPDEGWSLRPWQSPNGPVLLVGGEGHPMSDHVSSARHYAALAALARDRFGVAVEHRWSAFDYETTDGAPFIGRLSPRSRRRHVATGFDKWGMTTGMVAATIISDEIAGRRNPHADVFDSTRLKSTVRKPLVTNAAKVAANFVGDRISARRRSSAELPEAGQGFVTRRAGEHVAVARARDGQLHAVRATCTHLGCLVEFNDGDQSWDCPCHGSRFGLDGTVLDGPAVRPLGAVSIDTGEASPADAPGDR